MEINYGNKSFENIVLTLVYKYNYILNIMGSGIVQLASTGRQDKLFNYKPTITFFKSMYKRHTNYASQSMPQHFNIKPDFGSKVSCTIANLADLLGKINLVIDLPPIGNFYDIISDSGSGNSNVACCAWVKNIGYQIIKSVEIQLDDKILEKQMHDWFNIYHELHKDLNMEFATNKMIGNVPELTDFTINKNSYTLMVPLQFWFNRYPNMAFPIVSTYNSTVKINVEFSSLDDCLILGPTHYVEIEEEICLFVKGDILHQNVNGIMYLYKFIFHDPVDKRLYYIKITKETLKTNVAIYLGKNKNYHVLPIGTERLYLNKKKYFGPTNNLALGKTYLWVDFIFLEAKERRKFIKNKLDYVIDVVQFDNEQIIYQSSDTVKINHSNPCKELIFVCSNEYLYNGYMKDKFNYSNNMEQTEDLILKALINMNSQERLTEKNFSYYNKLHPVKYHSSSSKGIGLYSFGSRVEGHQYAGYCNLSEISNLEIKFRLSKTVSRNRPVQMRIYTIALRKLTFENGMVSLE